MKIEDPKIRSILVFLVVFLLSSLVLNWLMIKGIFHFMCIQNCSGFMYRWLPILRTPLVLVLPGIVGVSGSVIYLGYRRLKG